MLPMRPLPGARRKAAPAVVALVQESTWAPASSDRRARGGASIERDGGPGETGNDRPSLVGRCARRLDPVDSRSEIKEFLASRRARVTPEQAAIPVYGRNRRVKGLRREEVALLAGVGVDNYVRMERGNLRGVSEQVLDALARALQLDEAERAHLFDLARAANAGPAARRHTGAQRVRPSVKRILDLVGAPAWVPRSGHRDRLRRRARRGTVSRVGAPQYDKVPMDFGVFLRNVTLTGGVAPARAYIDELLPDILDGRIEPGRVFDRTVGLEEIPAGYEAMAERSALKVLVRP